MSAPRDDSVYLQHMRDAAARIQSYLTGVDEFLSTPLLQDAVLHQIQILGEAAKRLSRTLRSETPDVPWADIAGMRDKLVHDYMGVDLEMVWETVSRDIPELRARLQTLGTR